ncbi:hypothetical protein [Rhodoferax sp.]|uniref:hypothetical protein n=1 Tax=Rhodoferax sp. TaxID=50421 RepID=UPI0025DE3B8A|nr:hypothetical protein [Rhodoferax sp.]
MTPRITALFAASTVMGQASAATQPGSAGFAGVVGSLSPLHWALIAVSLALVVGLVILRVRRNRAARAMTSLDMQPTMFAHTVMADNSINQRTVPQPLAPHPHADQVWTSR